MRHSLYKFYSERRWAEAFLEGQLLFRSLAYFRDYEDNKVRRDQNEGTSVFRPEGGLIINNETQGNTLVYPEYSFASTANQKDIFVFCVSRSNNEELRERFEADICIEILDIKRFCARVEAALPPTATFPGQIGRTRIGHRVEYYKETAGSSPRWALPDVIVVSKFDSYAWQDEFRLVFCLTNALEFQKVDLQLMQHTPTKVPNSAEHQSYQVGAGGLRDICRLHEF